MTHIRLLSQDRAALADVPAVYFVEPTSENVKKIGEVTRGVICLFHKLFIVFFFVFFFALF
jgi:hypothetical protein